MRRWWISIVFLMFSATVIAQEDDSLDFNGLLERINNDTTNIEINGNIHLPDELFKITGQSSLYYIITVLSDTGNVAEEEKPVLSNQLYIRKEGDKLSLYEYELSGKAGKIKKAADDLFEKEEYAASIKKYLELYNKDTTYYFALTLAGDCFYNLGDYENAIFYFDKAIAGNFIDYDAHWFKADALRRLGDMDGALREITIAHLLNVNYENLNLVFRRFRELAGRPWKEMDFEPRYELQKSGDSIFVNVVPGSVGYAIAKAIWKYEPGYAEKMTGKPREDDLTLNSLEETEAAIAMLVENQMDDMFNRLVEDDMIHQFVSYEFISKKYPSTLLFLPGGAPELFDRLIDYINRYH